MKPDDKQIERYSRFHGYNPDRIINQPRAWVPGNMYYMGRAIDIGYKRATERSNKDARYVHDFEDVKIYCRDKIDALHKKAVSIIHEIEFPLQYFPQQLNMLGYNLGFSFTRNGHGCKQELKASKNWYLCSDPHTGKLLAVVDNKGIRYVFFGGTLYIDDWIYN